MMNVSNLARECEKHEKLDSQADPRPLSRQNLNKQQCQALCTLYYSYQ